MCQLDHFRWLIFWSASSCENKIFYSASLSLFILSSLQMSYLREARGVKLKLPLAPSEVTVSTPIRGQLTQTPT